MIMLKQSYVLALITISLLVGGCIEPNISSTTPSHEVTSTNPIVAAESLTKTAVPVSTEAPFLMTEIPTLSLDDAQSKLIELLTNNGGCKLPCFWGINPDKSSFQETMEILVPLSDISQFTHFETGIGAIDPEYVEDELIIHTSVRFLSDPNTNIVSHIAFTSRALNKVDGGFIEVFVSSAYSKLVDYYMLKNILTRYGNPTRVMLSTMARLPSNSVVGGFKILLLYPDQGILVNYTMQMQIVGENIMGCPSDSSAEFELYASGQSNSFFDFLEPTGWPQIIENTYKPIDEVTAMTKDDFYQLFSEQTEECVLTPASLWPIPN